MKVIKSLVLGGFIAVGVSSCFDPPEFPITPEINNAEVYFGVTPDLAEMDSLVVSVDFRDGNGDLGIATSQTSDPYHAANFFFIRGNGDLEAVATITGVTNESSPRTFSPILWPAAGVEGELATLDTRNDPDYSFLPADVFPYSCSNYVYNQLYISEDHIELLDPSYNYDIIDTVQDVRPRLYLVEAPFYTEYNPNQFNITVEFQIKTGNTFTTFDWRQQLCTTFDGRFPILSDKTAPLEGTIHYAMKSSGFYNIFSTQTLRLKIQIMDRAFNKSNTIYTKEFTLDQIKQN